MTRYLRIAAATFFVLLTVALIGLWVRSYHVHDLIYSPLSKSLHVHSGQLTSKYGVLAFAAVTDKSIIGYPVWPKPYWRSRYLRELERPTDKGFRLSKTKGTIFASVPHWFLVAGSFALAALFAFKRTWRFSIRSILIATALIAIAFGLGVYIL